MKRRGKNNGDLDDEDRDECSVSASVSEESLVHSVMEALISHYSQQPIHSFDCLFRSVATEMTKSLEQEEEEEEEEDNDEIQKKRPALVHSSHAASDDDDAAAADDDDTNANANANTTAILKFQLRRLLVAVRNKNADGNRIWAHLVRVYGSHMRPLLLLEKEVDGRMVLGLQQPKNAATSLSVLIHYELFLSHVLQQHQKQHTKEETTTVNHNCSCGLVEAEMMTLERIACDITLATSAASASYKDEEHENEKKTKTNTKQKQIRMAMVAALIRLLTLVLRSSSIHYRRHLDQSNSSSLSLERVVQRCVVSLLAFGDGGRDGGDGGEDCDGLLRKCNDKNNNNNPPSSSSSSISSIMSIQTLSMTLAPDDLQERLISKNTGLLQQSWSSMLEKKLGLPFWKNGDDDEEDDDEPSTTTTDAIIRQLRRAVYDFWQQLSAIIQESNHHHNLKDEDAVALVPEAIIPEEEEEESLCFLQQSGMIQMMRLVLFSSSSNRLWDLESMAKAVRAHFFGRDMMVGGGESAIATKITKNKPIITTSRRLFLGKTVPHHKTDDPECFDSDNKPYRKIPSRVRVVWQFIVALMFRSSPRRRESSEEDEDCHDDDLRRRKVTTCSSPVVWEELVPVCYELLSSSSYPLNAVGAAMVHDLVSCYCCYCDYDCNSCSSSRSDKEEHRADSDSSTNTNRDFWSRQRTSIDNLLGMLDIIAKTCRDGTVLAAVARTTCRLFSLNKNHYRSQRRLACQQWLTILYQNQTRVSSDPLLIAGLLAGIIRLLYYYSEDEQPSTPQGANNSNNADSLEVGRLGLSALLPLLGADIDNDWFDQSFARNTAAAATTATSTESSFASSSQNHRHVLLQHDIRLSALVALNNLLIAAHPMVPRHAGKILSHLVVCARQTYYPTIGTCNDADENDEDHDDDDERTSGGKAEQRMIVSRHAVALHVASTALVLCGDKGEQFLRKLEEKKDEDSTGGDHGACQYYEDQLVHLVRSIRVEAQTRYK